MKFININEIKSHLPGKDQLMTIMEQAFIDYSSGKYTIPPVGHLPLEHGELHIKYGAGNPYKYATIKIASGSYKNIDFGLPNSSGCILLINQETGYPDYILEDKGLLTDHRTAAAGALMSKEIMPAGSIPTFGIIGCGIQGFHQTIYTCHALGLNKVYAYDIHVEAIEFLYMQLIEHDIQVIPCSDVKELCSKCDLITTVTPAISGFIHSEWLNEGTHINAFGCDTKGKQELTDSVIQSASIIYADCLRQCSTEGELQYLYNDRQQRQIKRKTREFGHFLADTYHSKNQKGITVADFTGIAVQDIAIANYIINSINKEIK